MRIKLLRPSFANLRYASAAFALATVRSVGSANAVSFDFVGMGAIALAAFSAN
jgi:hypothetical protein